MLHVPKSEGDGFISVTKARSASISYITAVAKLPAAILVHACTAWWTKTGKSSIVEEPLIQ